MEFEYMQMLARKDAMKAGREEGLREGFREGLKEGEEIGLERGRLESFASLVQDGILSLSDAARRSGLSEEKLKEWIQHEQEPSLKHA